MRLYSRKEINDQKWNDCILNSSSCILYAQSWYLDIFSPNWKALIRESEDQYELILPLPVKRKFFIPVLLQPLFVQQSGFFLRNNSEISDTELQQILNVLSGFPISVFNFNVGNNCYLQSTVLQPKTNFILKIEQDITAGFNQNRKRDLKKTAQDSILLALENKEEIVDLYYEYTAPFLKSVKKQHRQKLLSLTKRVESYAFVLKNNDGELLSFALFVSCNNKLYYPFGGSTELGKKKGGFTRLIVEVTSRLNQFEYLDFEGGSIAGLHQLYQSFGSIEETYFQFKKNILGN